MIQDSMKTYSGSFCSFATHLYHETMTNSTKTLRDSTQLFVERGGWDYGFVDVDLALLLLHLVQRVLDLFLLFPHQLDLVVEFLLRCKEGKTKPQKSNLLTSARQYQQIIRQKRAEE